VVKWFGLLGANRENVPSTHVAILNSPTTNANNILLAPTAQTNRTRKITKLLT
jgi:hypothetical protein